MKIPTLEALEVAMLEADERGELTPRHVAKMLRRILVRVDATLESVGNSIEFCVTTMGEAKP